MEKIFKTYKPANKKILVHGRTHYQGKGPLPLFWSGSGIEMNIRGCTAVYADVETDYNVFCQWVTVEVNGAFVARMPVPKGRTKLCLICGRDDENAVSRVRLYKDVQPMPDDQAACLLIHGIETDGALLAPPKRKLRMEFIGDSYTSGEGAYGALGEADWIPMWFSGSITYPNLVAKALDADFHIVSQCGWGIVSGFDNNPASTVPSIYDKVCGAAYGERNAALGAANDWDFSSWQPDVVIINLGANDEFAMECEPFTAADGTVAKQQDTAECLERISRTAERFLAHVREVNPNALIMWVRQGGSRLIGAVSGAIDRRRMAGDGDVWLCVLDQVEEKDLGARWHPGAAAHKKAAESIVRELMQEESIQKIVGKK
ncbi:MAG: GDSL family lipase [Ruminococcaceae bacterium]|nr:GDSL family lipase [Oscillospiraceae bacterium]